MLGYSQLDSIHVIFINEAKYKKNVHGCHIMSVRQTNQYLKDKRESFTLQFTPCQFRSHIPSVMPKKSSIRVLSGSTVYFTKGGTAITNVIAQFKMVLYFSHTFQNSQHTQMKLFNFAIYYDILSFKLIKENIYKNCAFYN